MKTKKLRFMCKTYNSYIEAEKEMKKIGVKIIMRGYDAEFDHYIYEVEGTKEQAYALLDYANLIGGLLAKGE